MFVEHHKYKFVPEDDVTIMYKNTTGPIGRKKMLPYYDIDEMRASGYCPSTIGAAETYNARWDALFASPIGQYLHRGHSRGGDRRFRG